MRKMNSHTQRTPRIRRGRKENRWIFWLSAATIRSLVSQAITIIREKSLKSNGNRPPERAKSYR